MPTDTQNHFSALSKFPVFHNSSQEQAREDVVGSCRQGLVLLCSHCAVPTSSCKGQGDAAPP